MSEPLLSVDGISKSYAGVRALSHASFSVNRGEVHAIVGENGAGKSTLIKIITGAVIPDQGTIHFDGNTLTDNSPAISKKIGIAPIYQQPSLFPELSVAENLTFGSHTGFLGLIDWNKRRAISKDLLSRIGAKIDVDATAASLSMPQQQLVEIARALDSQAKLFIFDEPTASLSEEDTRNLFDVIRGLKNAGAGIVYISHRLEELPIIADRVTVLRDGRTIETRSIEGVTSEDLVRLMVGRELSAVFPKRDVQKGEVRFELKDLASRSAGIHNVNLSVRAGEIVGVSGLVGAGRTELAKVIFGLEPKDSGDIIKDGSPVTIGHPIEAISHGIAYLPEDRRRHGVVLDLPISANITLASLKNLTSLKGMSFSFARERKIAAEYTRRLGVKTQDIHSSVSTLSGGNQQKVALSRWLMTEPTVLILDEPTQGIDVGAKSEIHELMMELAEKGVAIVLISSELPEILGMSDRIAVMNKGTIVKIFDRSEASQDSILAAALGHDKEGS